MNLVMTTIFTEIIERVIPGFFVYEDKNYVAILDKYPIDYGHTLVIPKKPYELLTEMPINEVGELFSLVPVIANAVKKGTGADAFSIAQNNGKAAKQIVPHVHVHIIPRYSNKGTTWTKRSMPSDTEQKELCEKIRKCF